MNAAQSSNTFLYQIYHHHINVYNANYHTNYYARAFLYCVTKVNTTALYLNTNAKKCSFIYRCVFDGAFNPRRFVLDLQPLLPTCGCLL